MAHDVIVFIAAAYLLFVILTFLPATVSGDAINYTTPVVCLRGSDRSEHVDVDCLDKVTDFAFVFVTRVIHGLTPTSSGCDVTAPKATCCPDPADPVRDCVFSNGEETKALRERCEGVVTCSTSLQRAAVADRCQPRQDGTSYGRYSDFARVEFICVGSAQVSDMCDSDMTLTGDHLFLETNVFHDNRHHSNKTCSCVVTTACQNSLIFKVLHLDLNHDADASGCRESLVLTEGDGGGVLTNLNCSYDPLSPGNGETAFYSQSSVAGLDLHVTGNNTGKVLVEVTATNGASVEILCGQPSSQSLLTDRHCSAPIAPPPSQDVSSPTYNTTREACLQGRDISQDFEISCLDKGAPGLISVERILQGLTPDAMGCDVTAPRNNCCPGYDPARDCVFSSQEGLAELREKCDGAEVCYPSLRKAAVHQACPPRQGLTYGAYSYFAFVEFSCINTGLLGDVCDAGSTVRNKEVYLESNVYHVNSEKRNTSCACHVTAPCRHQLYVTLLLLDLASTETGRCLESVVLDDGGNDTVSLTLDCNSNQLDEEERGDGGGTVFVSQSNFVIFKLHLPANHTGKMLFRVTATNGSTVEVRCGRTTELDVWDKHRCSSVNSPSSSTSSTVGTITSASMTSTTPGLNVTNDSAGTSKGSNNDDDNNNNSLNSGVAIGVGVVAFLVVLLIIILIVIIWRSKKRSPDDDSDHYIVRYVGPDPEPLAIINPSITTDYDNIANTIRDPHNDQDDKQPYDIVFLPEEEAEEGAGLGAVGGVANPVYVYTGNVSLEKDKKMMDM